MASSRMPKRLAWAIRSASSAVSPELDSASTASPGTIMPRSPWLASAGCTNSAGVPVEANVAAILRAIWPDLPMPVTTTRPRTAASRATACGEAAIQRGGELGQPGALGFEHGQRHGEVVRSGIAVERGGGLQQRRRSIRGMSIQRGQSCNACPLYGQRRPRRSIERVFPSVARGARRRTGIARSVRSLPRTPPALSTADWVAA